MEGSSSELHDNKRSNSQVLSTQISLITTNSFTKPLVLFLQLIDHYRKSLDIPTDILGKSKLLINYAISIKCFETHNENNGGNVIMPINLFPRIWTETSELFHKSFSNEPQGQLHLVIWETQIRNAEASI